MKYVYVITYVVKYKIIPEHLRHAQDSPAAPTILF